MASERSKGFLRCDFMYGIFVHSIDCEQHARALHHGLAMLPDNFVCEVCWCCNGRGTRTEFGCGYCRGSGLTQAGGDAPATDSMRHQVLVAASRSLLLDFEVRVV